MNCQMMKEEYKDALADLLLDPEQVSAKVRAHVDQCVDCAAEIRALQGTMQALNSWEDVEPSPFFDARMAARMRKAREEKPAGWFERMQAWLTFGTNLQLKPIAAGVLALLLMAGGGTFAGLKKTETTAPVAASATVRDLQSLDENAQVFQALNTLDQGDGGNASVQNSN